MIAAAAIAQAPAGGAKTENTLTANPPAATNHMANPPRRGGPGGFGFGRPAPLPAGVKWPNLLADETLCQLSCDLN